jgi:adenylyltransferase/sulfurtransferase
MMPAQTLTDYDRRRYNRQMLIRGFGEEGQEKLKNARVFIAGCGGLGSPIAYYMAVAGFGTLVIADMDIVDLSNLNRQILHWDQNVGEDKVKSGYEKLVQINPSINIVPFNGRIDENNVLELTKGCDLIMDAMDNFETRYLLNRA